MFITIDKKTLLAELKTASIVAELNVNIRADDKLTFTATNGRIFVKTVCDAEIKQPGAITLDCHRLYGIISVMPNESITIQSDDNHWVTITADKTHFYIPGVPADEFPEFPKFPDGEMITLPYMELMSKIGYALATEQTQGTLCGARILIKDGILEAVATDGHRLALLKTDCDNTLDCVIPRKVLDLIKTDVQLIVANDIYVKTDTMSIVAHAIEGHYPNYKLVMPDVCEIKVYFNRERLMQAIKRASVMTPETFFGIIFKLDNGMFYIECDNEMGSVKDQFEIDYCGTPFITSYNPKYLLDALQHIDTNEVIFNANSQDGPAIITPCDTDNYQCLIMPMRMRER